MSALAIVAGTLGFVILVLAACLRSVMANNRQLIRALIARNAHEVVVLDQSEARVEAAKPAPFSRRPLPVDDDEYDLIPMGL